MKILLFFVDDFDKANRKLKECEEFSDLQATETEEEIQNKKRKRKPNKKYINTSSEDENNENLDSLQPPSKLYKSGEKNIYSYFSNTNKSHNNIILETMTLK